MSGERSNRLLAQDWLERAMAQLVQATYELSIVGPNCDAHWRKAQHKVQTARDRLDQADDCLASALAPFSPDLAREHDKIVTRRQDH